eukprot:snap_masked-scaffold_1-processed-gene-27.39-mRNA-1 protein AED:1.00 eAED:1.00 QI:0/0/0/0/1/1/2/0/100
MIKLNTLFHKVLLENMKPLMVDYEGRKVDVIASLEHVFNNPSPNGRKLDKVRKKKLHKQHFEKAVNELLLFLDEEELEVALAAFPKDRIKFEEFKSWWIS